MKWLLPFTLGAWVVVANVHAAEPQPLALRPGDHIAVIGSGLADRMQHDGWFETLIHQAHPQDHLVFRNLAFSGDEVVTRLRTETGVTRQEWLAKTQADVVLAFFGFNESFAGQEGLAPFKQELEHFIADTLAANYSGKGAPRLVLFSPTFQEKGRDPNWPDPTANNRNLTAYTMAMAEVCAAKQVPFVDLYTASQKLSASAKQSLTFNGIHLTEIGDQLLAPLMYAAVFGASSSASTKSLEKLRAAVVDKNESWHNRYRTVDSFNIYGERSTLSYESGKGGPRITNASVMQAEMNVRDVMTANRDQRVWAIAQGGDLTLDDANLPSIPAVKTNLPGVNPDGSHRYLGGEEAIARMTVAKGCKVTLFASEEQFPELVKPVQMAWDTKGRLWVSAWTNYPERAPTNPDGDKLLVFEDTNGDGKADKVTTFLGDLNCPTGFQFFKDGVLVMESPDLWYVRDTDGDGKADWKERVLMGLDAADSHHETNSMVLDPGGATYLSDGIFMRSQVETAAGPVRNVDGAIYRYEPGTHRFERYIAYNFMNPHGRVFDYWGTDLITDATGNENFFAPPFSGRIDYPHQHGSYEQFWRRPSRPCAGTGMLSSRHFPPDMNGSFLNCNVIGMQGIFRIKLSEDGSGVKGETAENLLSSSDPNFRATGVSVAPDGSLYVLDWACPIIGHMQHHLRDPNRDHQHGRIYRITYEGRPLLTPAKIDGQAIYTLLDLLKEPENDVRTRAKLELGKHDAAQVIPAVNRWVAALDPQDPAYQHHLLEALWVHQWHNVVDVPLLTRVLRSPDFHARAAATRVLCYWRDRVPETLTLLRAQAEDESPRVRLEAVRACSFFRQWEAADVALLAVKRPLDYYLTYCLRETMRQLSPWWKTAFADGIPLAAGNPPGAAFVLTGVATGELAKLPKSEPVWLAMFSRADASTAVRQEALLALAKLRRATPLTVLLDLVQPLESAGGAPADVSTMLLVQPLGDLRAGRAALQPLTTPGHSAPMRQAGIAALMLADGSPDPHWSAAGKSPEALIDVLTALTLVPDAALRSAAAERVMGLLGPLPGDLTKALAAQSGPVGRFVRIQLPRRDTLTLAEVEVFSGGKNIATGGTATQSTTDYGAGAERAIDGKTDGAFGKGTSTHTIEDQERPWWEVDLGAMKSLEAITVWNRTDGGFDNRLDGFVLTVLDGERREVLRLPPTAKPDPSVRLILTRDLTDGLRRAAIAASVVSGVDPKRLFSAFSSLIAQGQQIVPATLAMKQVPRAAWSKDSAGSTIKGIITWLKVMPVAERTATEVVEVIAMARELAGLLPEAEAQTVRVSLGELSVATYTLTTVREKMRYDQERLVVEAGKPLEITFKNVDGMPHNLVVIAPGTREKVGQLALALTPAPDQDGRAYVPKDVAVLAATRLVEPGKQEVLRLVAPSEPGEYEYVCTFPGHYLIMWGRLVVTKDVAAYQSTHPMPATTK